MGSGAWLWSDLGYGVLGCGTGVCFWERERTVVNFEIGSERERDPDILEQLGPSSSQDVPHLVQPHIGCDFWDKDGDVSWLKKGPDSCTL